jgi:hypothetical protein
VTLRKERLRDSCCVSGGQGSNHLGRKGHERDTDGQELPSPPPLMLTSYIADGHTSCLCTYALYGGSVHNVFDACRYITRASGRGLGPLEIKRFLGTVKWHRADRGVPFWAQKTQGFQGRTPPTCSSNGSAFIKNQYKLGHINHRCIGGFMYKSPRVIFTEFIDTIFAKETHNVRF